MRFSTRARYGLRMMVELARESRGGTPVTLNRVARITGLSEGYLGQLVLLLKTASLVIGISGKNGGYVPARPPGEIKLIEVIRALQGPINLAECADHPEICLNSCFCETRVIWVLLNHRILEVLEQYTLKDLTDRARMAEIRKKNANVPMLDADLALADAEFGQDQGCPIATRHGASSAREGSA
ncbi:MAG: Rrf2 family transcriptional regulator [Acidobacteriota bacterium]